MTKILFLAPTYFVLTSIMFYDIDKIATDQAHDLG